MVLSARLGPKAVNSATGQPARCHEGAVGELSMKPKFILQEHLTHNGPSDLHQ
jgi:hypothetical protein